jgi:hypothetical protein
MVAAECQAAGASVASRAVGAGVCCEKFGSGDQQGGGEHFGPAISGSRNRRSGMRYRDSTHQIRRITNRQAHGSTILLDYVYFGCFL